MHLQFSVSLANSATCIQVVRYVLLQGSEELESRVHPASLTILCNLVRLKVFTGNYFYNYVPFSGIYY